MMKLLGLVVAMSCAACMAQGQKRAVVEKPDETIGDLRCSAPKLTVFEALYYVPSHNDCVSTSEKL